MKIESLSKESDDSIAVFSIGRPSINMDSEWISFEKSFNHKIEKYEVYFSNQSLKNENEYLKFGKPSGSRIKKHYAENIVWPKTYDSQAFYFLHNKPKKGSWYFEAAEIDEDSFLLYGSSYPTSTTKFLGRMNMDYIFIPDYGTDESFYLIVTLNSSTKPRKLIVGYDLYIDLQHPISGAIFDSDDSDYNRNLVSNIDANDILDNPVEFKSKEDMNEDGYFQVLTTFKSQTKVQSYDLYYFCDINNKQFDSNLGYQLFPREKDYFENGAYYPFCNQFEPSFNFNGSKVAFLNQRTNSNSEDSLSEPCSDDKDIDLWVFDVSEYFEKVCLDDYELNEDNSSFSHNYFMIDKKIRNLFRFAEETNSKLSLARDYAWHPNRDIIFYISEKKNDEGEIIWPISYYNFENCKSNDISSCESGILETYTLDNRHISLSPDGEYLLFSFSKINKKKSIPDIDDPNKINIPNVENGKCYNCELHHKWKVAKAKIVINE